jgi:hypothetical protein
MNINKHFYENIKCFIIKKRIRYFCILMKITKKYLTNITDEQTLLT